VPFVGYLFFSEKINHKLWMPVLLGYAGVAIVLNPDSNFFNPAALLAFGSAIALAFTVQVVRKLTATDSITTITFYFLIFSTLLSGIISIPFWQPVSTAQLIIMAEIGALYFSSQYLANASMKYANPQLISSLMYSNVIYAAIISLLVWNILPSLHTVIGIILVVVGSIACIRIEHMSVKRAAQQVLFE
jgi:drug/metabolite transporter (DMT)-like permease